MTDQTPISHAVGLFATACAIAGSRSLLTDTTREFRQRGLLQAIATKNTAALFGWLMEAVSFQGVSDQVAAAYLQKNGSVTWPDISAGLVSAADLSKAAKLLDV